MIEDYAALYSKMHENEKYFSGVSIKSYVDRIVELVGRTQPLRLLDYGSGKGYQYLVHRYHERWGGLLPYCYDVGVRQLRNKPEGRFCGVICSDVMEHIAEEDVDEVLADIFGMLREDEPEVFAFFGIACRPAKKKLPDGRDVHLTVKPPAFWDAKIARFERPCLIISAQYDE